MSREGFRVVYFFWLGSQRRAERVRGMSENKVVGRFSSLWRKEGGARGKSITTAFQAI
jgi:hypothetical protein